MTDFSPQSTRDAQKRALRRGVWLLFGFCLAVVLLIGGGVALLTAAQVGVVSQVMTMVICYAPLLLVLLLAWLALSAAIYGVQRLDLSVTRQLATLHERTQSANIRAQTAGAELKRAVRRVVIPIDRFLARLPSFEAAPPVEESSDEQ